MGYKILYSKTGNTYKVRTAGVFYKIIVYSIIITFLILSLACGVYQKNHMISDHERITTTALNDLAEDLKNGESVTAAFAAFCQGILDHANIPE